MWDSNHIPAALIRTCHLDQLRRYSGLEKVTLQADLGTSWGMHQGMHQGNSAGCFTWWWGLEQRFLVIYGDGFDQVIKTQQNSGEKPRFRRNLTLLQAMEKWRKCSHRGRGTLVVLALCCVSRVFGATLFTPRRSRMNQSVLEFPMLIFAQGEHNWVLKVVAWLMG